jgi:hypothetical protein
MSRILWAWLRIFSSHSMQISLPGGKKMRISLKNKKHLALIIVVAAALLAAFLFAFIPPRAEKVPQALQNSLISEGRYEYSCIVEVDGEAREYFWLKGEMEKDRRHIEGRVLGTELELYYQDNNIYRYDINTESWYAHEVADLTEAAALYAELEPAAAFLYDDLIEIEYLGRDSKGGRTCYNYAVLPVPSGWIGEFFTDVQYILGLSRWGQLLHAEISATAKDATNTSMRAFLIFDADHNVKIEAPIDLVQ